MKKDINPSTPLRVDAERSRSIKNIQASIRARLQNKAKETNRPFSEVLQYYGMERFLYRFSRSQYADKFILKGALMFTVWRVPERRITLDIDFLARFDNQITSIEKVLKDVCKVTVVPDGLVFDPETVKGQRIKEDADYEGVRVKFRGFLERSCIPMQVDVGFGDAIYPKPKAIDYPVILDLPEDQPLFAEEIYDEKSDRQTLWKAFLKKGDIKHAPEKLQATAREIEGFLTKPLDAINKEQGFNSEWKAPGPWKDTRCHPRD
jgi:hypothetical protein